MQIDGVGGIADRAQNVALACIGIGEHGERLIAMGGDHDVIVGIASAVTVVDNDAMGGALD